MTGEWLIPDYIQPENDQLFEWAAATGDTANHQFYPQSQTQFLDVNGRVRYGAVMYPTKQVCKFTLRNSIVFSPPTVIACCQVTVSSNMDETKHNDFSAHQPPSSQDQSWDRLQQLGLLRYIMGDLPWWQLSERPTWSHLWVPILSGTCIRLARRMVWNAQGGRPVLCLDGRPTW